MLAVLVIGLALSLSLLAILAGFAFFDAAWNGPRRAAEQQRMRQAWSPPQIHDDELFGWASRAAATVVRDSLAQPDANVSATELVARLYEGLDLAIAGTNELGKFCGEVRCAECSGQLIGVSPPEALAIAESVHCRTPQDAPRIHATARDNAARAAELNAEQYAAAQIRCPLFGADDSCAAGEARPIHCRGQRTSVAEGSPADAGECHSRAISRGVAKGLAEELHQQGLDGTRYELNAALAAAFENPEIDEAWARGEAAFGGCRRV